jgi:hypothetical protein
MVSSRPRPLGNDSRAWKNRATERPDPGSVTRTAASRDAGTNDLLLGDVLGTNENELPERR